MRSIVYAAVVGLVLLAPAAAPAQSTSSASELAQEGTVPVTRLIAMVAKKTGKKFILDPRVRVDVLLIGQDPSSVGYADLLEILQVHGFVAVEGGGYVRVVPDGSVRAEILPVVSGKESRPDAEWITKVLQVHSVPAAQLVPLLRPMLPQQAHLMASPCTNVLLVVGTVAKVRQIETLVAALDEGPPYKSDKCEGQPPAAPRREN